MRRAHCLCVLVSIALGGCAAIHHDVAKYDGKRLSAAGFTTRQANSADPTLPPLTVVAQNRDGHLAYHFADPYLCGCEYVGDEQAYARYRLRVEHDYLDALLSGSE